MAFNLNKKARDSTFQDHKLTTLNLVSYYLMDSILMDYTYLITWACLYILFCSMVYNTEDGKVGEVLLLTPEEEYGETETETETEDEYDDYSTQCDSESECEWCQHTEYESSDDEEDYQVIDDDEEEEFGNNYPIIDDTDTDTDSSDGEEEEVELRSNNDKMIDTLRKNTHRWMNAHEIYDDRDDWTLTTYTPINSTHRNLIVLCNKGIVVREKRLNIAGKNIYHYKLN